MPRRQVSQRRHQRKRPSCEIADDSRSSERIVKNDELHKQAKPSLSNGHMNCSHKHKQSYHTENVNYLFHFLVCALLFSLAALSHHGILGKSEQPLVYNERRLKTEVSAYLNGHFYIPHNPPLVPQFLAALSFVTTSVNFRQISSFVLGFLLVTLYFICIVLGFSTVSSIVPVFLVICESAFLTGIQYDLFLSLTLFSKCLSVFCCLIYRKERSFSVQWFFYLILFSFCLSVCSCCDYHSVFTCIVIIVNVFIDSWLLLDDPSWSVVKIVFRLVLEFIFLILIPLISYLGLFWVHLAVLNKEGNIPDAGYMSSAFQLTLQGGLSNFAKDQPYLIEFGSQVTLRNTKHTPPCWLHSHTSTYPIKYSDQRGSSHQQQVTCYEYKDVNNWWIVMPNDDKDSKGTVSNGDTVRLMHGFSRRWLNSHDVAAPLSPHSQEVSAYIEYNNSMLHPQLDWKVIFLNNSTNQWTAIDTEFSLLHVYSEMVLRVSDKRLPNWGFQQLEVVADDQKSGWNVWNVEEHKIHSKKPKPKRSPKRSLELDFISKVKELHEKMWSNVVGDFEVEKEREFYSCDPIEWFLGDCVLGLWIDKKDHLFAKPNLVVHYGLLCATVLFLLMGTVIALLSQRGTIALTKEMKQSLLESLRFPFMAFLLNLVPYCFTVKIVYLENYFSAFSFDLVLLGACLNILLSAETCRMIRFCTLLVAICWLCGAAVFIGIILCKK